MIYVSTLNTGDSKVSVPVKEIVRLNNSKISSKRTTQFVNYLISKNNLTRIQRLRLKRLEITFSYKPTKKLFGQAIVYWTDFCRIILYRHVAWVFLHELAHVLRGNRFHDKTFSSILDNLYDTYILFSKERRVKNARRIDLSQKWVISSKGG
jgi:hypothetical protein